MIVMYLSSVCIMCVDGSNAAANIVDHLLTGFETDM